MNHKIVWGASILLAFTTVRAADTLPPLEGRLAPTNLTEMWQGFDPLRDPLDVEIVREWKEGDATFRYVVFTIGTFKGQKSRVAAFYGFPKSDKRLPGLMHLHGGGQRAFIKTVRDAVKYGYAGLSVNWGGREMEDAKPGDKNTDYNAITMGFKSFNYDKSKALDPGDSPRNSGWFMAVLVARRVITFLQQQPEVDPSIIGVHGHSMGGKITTDLAGVDKRVTAAVPSCGSSGTLTYGGKIWNIPGSIGKTAKSAVLGQNTYESQAYLPTLTCPILHLNPMNDYNSPIDILTENWEKAASKTVYFSNAPHMCHLHLPENEVCTWLWFDQWLVHGFHMPKNTEISVDFKSGDGIPRVTVKPDVSRKIKAVDIYYSTEPHIITRFWRDGEAKAVGETYQAVCPILGLDKPFYAFANITYELEEPFKTKYGIDRYIITSKELIILPDELVKAGVKATDTKSSLIEDFSRGWHDWYGRWDKTGGSMTTYKIKDPKWRGGDGDLFCLEVKSLRDTKIDLTFSYNRWNCFMGGNEPKARPGSYTVSKEIKGSPEWQTVSVGAEELYTESKGLQMPPENQWQTIADVNVNAKIDEIRKIYWEKRTGAIPATKPKVPAKPISKMSAKPKNDLPELAGQSEEFKEAVRKSLEEEKAATPAKANVIMPLWPEGKMPGRGTKDGGVEKECPSRGDGVTRITNVSEPTITIYKTAETQKPTPAVIFCAGGGYNLLAMGPDMPAWLNSMGITVAVLKYRVPGNMGGAFQDIQRAMRLVRNNATQWNIATNRIGVMGISAGGHLCARLSTNWEKAEYPKLDRVDEEALRPDFAILLVPAYLSQVAGKLSKDIPVNANTPPTFTLHAEDDKTFVRGTHLYHAALIAANVQNEFFNPASGGHSTPLNSKEEIGQWTKKCQEWLSKHGIL